MSNLKYIGLCLVLVVMASCTTRSAANKKASETFMQGQIAAKSQSQQQIITVKGDVMNSVIPYTKDMTLAKALIAARWSGIRDPKYITITRGEESYKIKASDFFTAGEDLPLEPGDVIILER
mgnify:FL=1